MSAHGIVLFAHGARDPRWAEPFERLRSQVKASGERLLYAGAVKAQVQRGGRGPDLVVHRKVDGTTRALPVAEDGEVLPGDVLDVAIRPDLSVFAPGQ